MNNAISNNTIEGSGCASAVQPIAEAISGAFAIANALSENVTELERRIDPVLRSAKPSPTGGDVSPDGSCSMECALLDLIERLANINTAMCDLRSRVAL